MSTCLNLFTGVFTYTFCGITLNANKHMKYTMCLTPQPTLPLCMHSLSALLPLLQIDYGTVVSAETELCLRACAAPVLCLQCVLINWSDPSESGPLCIWPLHQTTKAKVNRQSQHNRLEGKPPSTAGNKYNDEKRWHSVPV